jgi:LPS O-antigen subunit length determinant protein (WzzB/FepE family)
MENQNNQIQQEQQATCYKDPDEINLLEYLYALVHWKWLIIGLTILGFVLGNVLAMKKGPKWVADVVIAPKESESQKTTSLSGLGALSGIVASQLNIGGNASLDKIDLILSGREFNSKLVEKYDLLPLIFKEHMPKAYKKLRDTVNNSWVKGFRPPKPLEYGGMVKGFYLKDVINKNNTMTLSIKSKDSLLSITLANDYIEFLNDYIKTNVQEDAKENVQYLETQLNGISDPLLREKLQSLIASEIEKQMVVSKEAFRIVDPVFMSKQFKEKRLYPMVFAAGLFFISCLFVVFMQAFSSAEKTEEDRKLLDNIKRELLFRR